MQTQQPWLAIDSERAARLLDTAWLCGGSWHLLERFGRDERGRYVEMRMVRA